MRILIVNPNTTDAVTSLMLDAGRASASPGVQVRAVTAPRGLPYITSRAEAQIGGAIALEMLAEAQGDCDAAILAAFGDPGLLGARELFEFPVIGISEAAMLTACMLGGRFLIVTFASLLCGWFRDCVAMHRLEDRCAGVVALDRGFGSLEDVRETNWEALMALANAAVADRDADVAILAGAPLAGLASRARDFIHVPVIDPIAAAVKQAEALVALGTTKASRGSFHRPAPKASSGLSAEIGGVSGARAVTGTGQVGHVLLGGRRYAVQRNFGRAPSDLPPARISQVAVEFFGARACPAPRRAAACRRLRTGWKFRPILRRGRNLQFAWDLDRRLGSRLDRRS